MRSLLCLGLACLLAVSAAGCTGGGAKQKPNDPADNVDFEQLDLAATSTTGVIRGIVVDGAIRPVAGVRITFNGPGGSSGKTETNPQGAFGFEGLAPGDYFLVANRSGYAETQASAPVTAGVAEPAIVKILLQADPSTAPFFELQKLEGFIQCSVRPMVIGEQCGVTSEDVVNAQYPFSRVPEFIQSEMVWESTQAAGDELSLAIRCLTGGDSDPAGRCPDGQLTIVRAEGKSPQVARINRTMIDNWTLGPAGDPLSLSLFAFGRSDLDVYNESQVDGAQEPVTGKPCNEWPSVGGFPFAPGTCMRATGPGLILNQKVDVYTHIFYGFAPPEAWQFSVDGDPVVPT